jgi:hypothetical protein
VVTDIPVYKSEVGKFKFSTETGKSFSGRGDPSELTLLLREKNRRIKELETELLLAARYNR